ncbi:MAG TPA: glycosyltransferase family 4 protein [Patescibacteria group bacterium]|nr:glycosyltransferase family 4 protein [Patescibacteria group bacterium]
MSAKRLKIALVSDAVLPFHKGGKETRIHHLAQELVQMGQDVHIYTMQWWKGADTYEQDGITYHALCRLYPLYHGKRRSIREGVFFGLACLKLIAYDFDILEVDHMPYFPLFSAKIVSVIKRKKLFATWHEVVGLKAWKAYVGPVAGTVAYAVEQLSIHLPDHIEAVSSHTYNQLRSILHYKGPLSLVSNGIDFPRITAAKPSKTSSDLLYAGRLIPHKNVELLIRAVAVLKHTKPAVRCIIIGTGSEFDRLNTLAAELGVQENITFTGRLESSDDLFALMKSSKVFVSPSFREGFGITILEAYACGLSAVTVEHPDNAAQHLVKKDLGIVCEPTPEAVAAAVNQLLKVKNPPTKSFAATYDWHKQASALKKVYGI